MSCFKAASASTVGFNTLDITRESLGIFKHSLHTVYLDPVYLMLPSYMTSLHVTSSHRRSSAVFAYYKQSNTGGDKGKKNEATLHYSILLPI